MRRSKNQAKKWYKLAARAGSIIALSNLGILYEDAGPWIRISSATLVYQWFEQIQE